MKIYQVQGNKGLLFVQATDRQHARVRYQLKTNEPLTDIITVREVKQ